MDNIQLAFMKINSPLTTAHIGKFLGYYGKPGENQDVKAAKLREVLDQMTVPTRNIQGIHICETLNAYEEF